MAYAPTERSRGGEYIGAGIASFGQSMGQGIERVRANKEKKIEAAKSESELAKASDAIAKNVPGFWDRMQISKEEWKNLSARDRWGAVTGLSKAQVLEEGAAQLSKTKEGLLALKATQSALKAASAGPPGGIGPQQPMGERLLGQLQNYPEAGGSPEFWQAAKALPNEQSVFRDATDRINADTGMMNANRLAAGGSSEMDAANLDYKKSQAEKNRRPPVGRAASGNNAMLQGMLLRRATIEGEVATLNKTAGVEGVPQGGGIWNLWSDTLSEKKASKDAELERLNRQIEVLQGSGMGGGGAPEQGEGEPGAAAAPAAGKAKKKYDPKTGVWTVLP